VAPPTDTPTKAPTTSPTDYPTDTPTKAPTKAPTEAAFTTAAPTKAPTAVLFDVSDPCAICDQPKGETTQAYKDAQAAYFAGGFLGPMPELEYERPWPDQPKDFQGNPVCQAPVGLHPEGKDYNPPRQYDGAGCHCLDLSASTPDTPDFLNTNAQKCLISTPDIPIFGGAYADGNFDGRKTHAQDRLCAGKYYCTLGKQPCTISIPGVNGGNPVPNPNAGADCTRRQWCGPNSVIGTSPGGSGIPNWDLCTDWRLDLFLQTGSGFSCMTTCPNGCTTSGNLCA
jgi:hypothetical protein